MKDMEGKGRVSGIRRRREIRPTRQPLEGSMRLWLNLSLATFIFFSPAMVMVFGDGEPQKDSGVWLASSEPGAAPTLTPFDTKVLQRHVDTRLPRYLLVFQQEARRHGIPWKLLAAQAYQESLWNPRAVSPTGVRGIMMLTRVTSASLGIRNRSNPVQSIRGGARHLAHLLRQLPSQVKEPDRTWFALAAYNVGMGHVKDARLLARRLGKDPNRWADLREVLPLLAQKVYYRTLPHRHARGWEPVQYVKRIEAYWDFLDGHYLLNSQPHASQL